MLRHLLILPLTLLGLSQAQAGPSYVVGVEALNYYPHYSNEGGNYSGFAREVLDAFAQSKGYTFEYRALPVARLYESFFNDKLDFKYPDNPNWQAPKRVGKNISYSAPVAAYTDGVLVLPANLGKGIEQLKTLGTVRDFTPWDYLSRIEQGQLKMQEVNDFKQSLLQGINSRVDGVYMNSDVGRYQLEKVLQQPGALVYDPNLPHSDGHYSLSSSKHPALIEEFNQYLSSHASEVTALKSKYQVQ